MQDPRRFAPCAMVVLCALAAQPYATMAESNARQFPTEVVTQLRELKEIHVATLRKDGTPSKVVPVWFGFVDDAIWFTTAPDSHKGRRVRKGSPMLVSVQGADGPFIKTKAEVVTDPDIAERLGALYSQKYWIAWLGLFRPSRSRVQSGKVLLLRLTPAP